MTSTTGQESAFLSSINAKENNTLIYNAKIYHSGNIDNTWMVFNRSTGFIDCVGKEDPPLHSFREDRKVNYDGKRILPGLHESHIHIFNHGLVLNNLNLEECSSIKVFQEQIAKYAKENTSKEWIIGRGWEQDLLGRFPTKEDIDAVCSDIPVLLIRTCGHVAVVNTKALNIAGINVETSNPPGGAIERYPMDDPTFAGQLNGILTENAIDIVKPFIQFNSSALKDTIKVTIEDLLRNGVTSAHACEELVWNEFCELADSDQLPIRIFMSAYFRSRNSINFPATSSERRGKMLSCDRVKIFVDGALGISTAALSRCYCKSSDKGMLLYSPEELKDLVHEATSAGFRLEIHVIGDRAAETALDALDAVNVAPEKRTILTHCQILREDLISRMKSRGVVANIQPQFLTTDSRWLPQILPPELLDYAYAWKTLLKHGVPCAGGSDAPVEPPCPLLGIYDAVFRQIDKRGPDNLNIFRPEKCLSIQEAIDLYTKGGAYATMKEDQLGQLLPGFQADFIVLDTDICADPKTILQTKVEEVWVAGVRRL